MPRKPSTRTPNKPDLPVKAPPDSIVAAVVPGGNRRKSLVAIRDRLAAETDDTLWAKHKAECRCTCGMGDGRLLVALVKELRSVIAELDAMPGSGERSKIDDLVDTVASLDGQRRKRATRVAGSAGS